MKLDKIVNTKSITTEFTNDTILLSECGKNVVRMLSDCGQTAVRML